MKIVAPHPHLLAAGTLLCAVVGDVEVRLVQGARLKIRVVPEQYDTWVLV